MKGIKELLIIIVCALSCVFIINYEYRDKEGEETPLDKKFKII